MLLPSTYGLSTFNSSMQLTRKERVPLRRLEGVFDEVTAAVKEPRVFLKVDTQGYDLHVIRGTSVKLTSLLGLQLEVALREIYEGMTTTAAQVIPGNGASLACLRPLGTPDQRGSPQRRTPT